MRAKLTILCFTTLVSACATLEQPPRASLVPARFGVETNEPIVLTMSQRARAYCVDTQMLVCESESGGRLGPFRCICPIDSSGAVLDARHD